jgi:hypothetical protein
MALIKWKAAVSGNWSTAADLIETSSGNVELGAANACALAHRSLQTSP